MAEGATTFSVTPMRATDVHFQVDRVYRESGPHQWVRETFLNAIEADATRVEFGIEWQAVENDGIYRRVIADNGIGMPPEELKGFFNTWGGGGKPIGGLHENFGIGAKSSLLPWNRYGIVVVSWHDGDAAMIWLMADPKTGEYGLRQFDVVDEDGEEYLDDVVAPFDDDEHGCNWAAVKPEWIKDHGTVIVLMGNEPGQHTVLGDPHREESDIKGVSTYLNRRIWEVPEGVRVTVDELRTNDAKQWPVSEDMAHTTAKGSGPDRRTNTRTIMGAKYYIEYPVKTFKAGKLSATGALVLSDGTELLYYLWDGERPAVQSYAAQGGFIGAVYKGELYDVTNHHSTYRSFGVTESSVRAKLWLIAKPPLLDESDGKHGVYPRGDRNSLLLKGGAMAGEPLPMNDWGAEFSDNMPEEILAALRAARAGESGSVTDNAWRDRLADRFGSRWRMFKLRASKKGKLSLDATQAGSRPRPAKRKNKGKGGSTGGGGGTGGSPNTGREAGPVPAVRSRVAGGIPTYITVRAEDVSKGMLAAWQPNHPEHAEGAVLLNIEHPVLEEEITYWQSQYPDHLAEEIAKEVVATYGEIAVAKVAHSEHLKSLIPPGVIEKDLRSEQALTMSLLGLIGEEAVIAPRIGGKLGKRRAA